MSEGALVPGIALPPVRIFIAVEAFREYVLTVGKGVRPNIMIAFNHLIFPFAVVFACCIQERRFAAAVL